VNGKIKNWKFMAQTIQNSSLPFLSDYLDIICALVNSYECPAVKDTQSGKEMATRMRDLWKAENKLQQRLEQSVGNRSLNWSKYNAATCHFPSLTEQDVLYLTFGKT
jgi:hypothetical protein